MKWIRNGLEFSSFIDLFPSDNQLAMIRKFLFILATSHLMGCQSLSKSGHRSSNFGGDDRLSPAKTAAWIKSERLVEATAGEIATAGVTEVRMENRKALLRKLGMEVTFTMGTMRSVSGPVNSGPQTTTSFYTLTSTRNGRIEAKIPSSLSSTMNGELPYKQRIWLSQDERRILIYDAWGDGSSTHEMYALVSAGPDDHEWNVKYLGIPSYTPFEVESGAVPMGFVGDVLLFNPGVSDKIYKRPLVELKEDGPPIPFTIG